MRPLLKIGFCFVLVLLYSCTEKKDHEALKAEATKQIVTLQDNQRDFHFKKMSKELVAQFSKEFLTVNEGVVSKPTKAESEAKFKAYFDQVTFQKWDDITPPVIRFSDDLSVAYVVVHKEVVLTVEINHIPERQRVEFSWLAIYKKTKGKWFLDCIVSTNKKPSIID